MDESPGMVLALDVERGDGKKLAVQTAEDILGPDLTPVGEHGLSEREFGLRCVAGIDAPTHLYRGLVDGLLVARQAQLVAHCAFAACWLAPVATHLPFFDLALDVILEKALHPIAFFDLCDVMA